MRKQLFIWLCLLLFAGKAIMAQEDAPQRQWRHNLYGEIGPKFMSHHSPNLEHFRPTGGYGSHIYVDSKIDIWQAAARYEIITPDYQWAFRTGVQYTHYWKQIGYDAYNDETSTTSYTPNHYMFEIQNDDNQLEYMRIRGIEQITNYVGIPLEVRYYFTYSDLPSFRIYVMAETDLDFMVGNKNQVNFINDAMAPYANQVNSNYDTPDAFNASTYLGTGFQVSKPNSVGVGFNWLIHLYDLCGSTGMLKQATKFQGNKLQIDLIIPLK